MSVVKREQIVGLCLCMLLLYKSFDYGMDSRNLKAEYDSTKTEDEAASWWSLYLVVTFEVYDD